MCQQAKHSLVVTCLYCEEAEEASPFLCLLFIEMTPTVSWSNSPTGRGQTVLQRLHQITYLLLPLPLVIPTVVILLLNSTR